MPLSAGGGNHRSALNRLLQLPLLFATSGFSRVHVLTLLDAGRGASGAAEVVPELLVRIAVTEEAADDLVGLLCFRKFSAFTLLPAGDHSGGV